MEWTRIGSTGLFQNISQQAPQKDRTVLQPTKIPSSRQKQSNITRSKSIKSRNGGQRKSQNPNVSSQNEGRARFQSAGIPKQTSSSRRRARSKSFLAKVQERDIGNDLRSLRHGFD
ncbi:hypothetical protein BDZ45DRAFT_802487 [Acephala macrosclerotiorum]|nr:hypothetical protein BDZ45DRAFT_802487 [Acephala macrosclerotiorum]